MAGRDPLFSLAVDPLGESALSPCQRYRYAYRRTWSPSPGFVLWICLNPSLPQQYAGNRTLDRCERASRGWGFPSLVMANLFAYQVTDPKDLRRQADPVGPLNDRFLVALSRYALKVVVGWGFYGNIKGRGKEVLTLLEGVDLYCLGFTSQGHPRHPVCAPNPWTLQPYPEP